MNASKVVIYHHGKVPIIINEGDTKVNGKVAHNVTCHFENGFVSVRVSDSEGIPLAQYNSPHVDVFY